MIYALQGTYLVSPRREKMNSDPFCGAVEKVRGLVQSPIVSLTYAPADLYALPSAETLLANDDIERSNIGGLKIHEISTTSSKGLLDFD